MVIFQGYLHFVRYKKKCNLKRREEIKTPIEHIQTMFSLFHQIYLIYHKETKKSELHELLNSCG